MGVESQVLQDERTVRIKVKGRFDFSLHREFRDAYKDHAADLTYQVDLGAVEYVDSSALGMLLLLRKHAGDRPDRVRLTGASGPVRRILEVARFDQLCTME